MADDPSAGLQAPDNQGMLRPGSRIAGYLIEEQVGVGGMAVVYRARDEVLGRPVAIKVLSPVFASDQEFRTRFLRESRAVAAVDESHIVPVYGAGDADGLLYIASRFVAGGDLSRLQRAAAGPLPPGQVADLISQIASALDAAHAIGLVHRDVKPGNILIEQIPGRPDHAYLSDFGLSKSATDATGLTVTGRFMGTPDYCAPEQITGAAVDGRADQYSLACVAFSLLAGVVPFGRGDSMARLFAHVNSPVPALTSIQPQLPTAVDAVLATGMAKNPAERYGSCAAFASALRGALGAGTLHGASLPAQPQVPVAPASFGYQQTVAAGASQHPSLPPGSDGWHPHGPVRAERSARKRRWLITGAAAGAAVVVAGVLAGVELSSHSGNTGGASALRSPSGATTPAAVRTSRAPSSPSAGQADHTGTAVLVGSLSAPGGAPMKGAFFSPDGTYIAAAGSTSKIYIFSTETLKLVNTVSVAADEVAYPVSFSSDDKTLYALGQTSSARRLYDLDVASGKATSYPLPADVSVTFNGISGRMIGTFTSAGPVTEYDAASGKVYARVPNPGKSAIGSADLDADGNDILISDTDGTAYLVDTRSKQVIGTIHFPYKGSSTVYPELTPDGNTVYVPGGSTAAARLWDSKTQSYTTPAGSRWPDPDNGLMFSIDSKFVLSSPTSVSETVDIWNVATRAHVITLTVPGSQNQANLSFGPSGSELLSTASFNIATRTFQKMNVWTIPG